MGLLSFVPHIFENDTDTAEAIHVYGIGETAETPIEREIGDAVDHAARAMAVNGSDPEYPGRYGPESLAPVEKPALNTGGRARMPKTRPQPLVGRGGHRNEQAR